jgi:Cu/Ag efflux pump CusA
MDSHQEQVRWHRVKELLLYLDLSYKERIEKGQMRNLADLKEAIEYGAVKRLRPKVMTVAVMFMGLVPIMWSQGLGSDVMRRIAAPMIGGIFTSFLDGITCLSCHLRNLEGPSIAQIEYNNRRVIPVFSDA